MAKNKKVPKPDGTFLVIVDPWGSPGHPNFVNNVAAWIEVMLSDEHPGMSVSTVYTQKQHRNSIVEFQEIFDATPFLGAHYHAKILSPPYNKVPADSVSYIYEYDYANYKDPGPRGWAAGYPSYDTIPDNFPIKQPYPIPSPAPNPRINYALRPKITAPNLATFIAPIYNPDTPLLSDSLLAGKGYHEFCQKGGPSAIKDEEQDIKHISYLTKQDPYEEADNAERLIRDTGRAIKREDPTQYPDFILPIKQESTAHRLTQHIKQEDSTLGFDQAGAFLNTIIPVKKEEPTTASTRDEYTPSAALLAAFATLPPGFFDQASDTTNNKDRTEAAVKNEHFDDIIPGTSSRDRSTTLATDAGTPGPSIRIKPEPQDHFQIPPVTRDPRVRPPVRVKPEPQDTIEIPPKPRDPRLVNHRKHPREEDIRDRDVQKKIKSECELY